MSNVLPPPPPPGVDGTPFTPVVRSHHVSWPKKKWLKLPLLAWIAAGVFAIGAIGAAAAPQKSDKQTVAAVQTDSPTTTVAATQAATLPAMPLATEATATVPPTVASTVPPTAAPTVPPTAAPTIPPTAAPTIPPTAAPTIPPTVAPTIPRPTVPKTPPTAAPPNECDPNYTPCVPIDSDVDCAGGSGNGPSYVRGPVRVIGRDIYGLDRNGDGIGCE